MIRENNITAPITNPIKDTLVPLRTNFNANGSVRWRTSVYLNLFHWPMGENSVNRKGTSINDVPRFLAFFDLPTYLPTSLFVPFRKSCPFNDVPFCLTYLPHNIFFEIISKIDPRSTILIKIKTIVTILLMVRIRLKLGG